MSIRSSARAGAGLAARSSHATASSIRELMRNRAVFRAASRRSRIPDAHGRLDIVFDNAGVSRPAPLGAIDTAEAQRLIMVDFTSPLALIQAVTPLMGAGGSIVLKTSALDVMGMPGMAVYAASKAAFRSLSAERAPRGIRVNAVASRTAETPIYAKLGLSPEALDAMATGLKGKARAGRFGAADDRTGANTFLASDASRYILGADLVVDGGLSTI